MASDVTQAQAVMLFCTKHTTEEMDMYCHQCKKATCTKCMTTDHVGHEADTIAKFSRKITNNRVQFFGSLTATHELKRRQKTRKFREVKCLNENVLSNGKNSLEKRRQKLHRVVDELIDKESDICQSQNYKLTDGIGNAEKKQAEADTKIGSMLAVFQKTTMTGIDIIEYYEDLRSRVESMGSDIDVKQFIDRSTYKEGKVDKDEMQRMVGNVLTRCETQPMYDEIKSIDKDKQVSRTTKEMDTNTVLLFPEQLSAFQFQESMVLSIYPVSRGKAWITYDRYKQFTLLSKDGLKLDSIQKDVVNAGLFVTDDNGIINCDYHKQLVLKTYHSGKPTRIMNTSPLFPITVGKALNSNILVTLVDKWSRSRTAESQRKVVMLTPGGEVLHEYQFGEDGSTPVLSFPTCPTQNYNSNVCVSNRYEVATKKYKGNVCVFYEDGGLKFVYSGQSDDFHPQGMCCDSLCNILCTDLNDNAVHIINSEGKFQRYLLTGNACVEKPGAVALYKSLLWIGSGGGEVRVYRYQE